MMSKRDRIFWCLVLLGIVCVLWHILASYTVSYIVELGLIISIFATIVFMGSLVIDDDKIN